MSTTNRYLTIYVMIAQHNRFASTFDQPAKMQLEDYEDYVRLVRQLAAAESHRGIELQGEGDSTKM
jgi:hypothetical protein